MTLTVEAYVSSISPSSGSKFGGTLVTITGVNFGTDPYDNPVKIGNTYCLVQTTSATTITCRIADTVEEVSSTSILVFLKTSEEASCAGSICDWSYVTPTHTITEITTAYDATSANTQASIVGTGLAEPCELWIDGYQQTFVSVSDTVAVFNIVNLDDSDSTNVHVYLNTGNVVAAPTYTLAIVPTFLTVTPSSGSSGGTLITITGSGFGTHN